MKITGWVLFLVETQTNTESVSGVIPGDGPVKMGFLDRFSRAFGLESGAELLASGEWDPSNPRHVVALQLIELSPVAD